MPNNEAPSATYTAATKTTPELLLRLAATFTAMCDDTHRASEDRYDLHTFTFDDTTDRDAGHTAATAEPGGEHATDADDDETKTTDPMWLFWGYLCDAADTKRSRAHTEVHIGTERTIDHTVLETEPTTHVATIIRHRGSKTATVTIENTFTYTSASGETTEVRKGETCTYTRADLR